MQITITTGTGSGPTELAAFDAALLDSGVANYNLICLSSIIPPGSVIQRMRFVAQPEDFGNKLYVVIARYTECQPGKEAWAGLGWVQDTLHGNGLFVEQNGTSHEDVELAIKKTLDAMVSSRGFPADEPCVAYANIKCQDQPVCALAIAVYQSEGWNHSHGQ